MKIYIVHEVDLFWKDDNEYFTSTRTVSIENYLEEMPFSENVSVKNDMKVYCVKGLIVQPNNLPDIIEVRKKWHKRKNLNDWYYYTEKEILQAIEDGKLVFINGLGEVDTDDIEIIKVNFNKVKVQ